MEYKNEFAREEIEQYSKENSGLFHFTTVRNLALSLLAEMDKPKVWDGAPNNAHSSMVVWYGIDGSITHSHDYTRELPKSRAREIAEEARSQYERGAVGAGSLDDVIESAILKALEEKKEGKE